VHGGEEQKVSHTEDHERQNHMSEFHSDDSSSGAELASAVPSQANGNTEKNHGVANPVVRRFLTDAERALMFFAGLRKQRRDNDAALVYGVGFCSTCVAEYD